MSQEMKTEFFRKPLAWSRGFYYYQAVAAANRFLDPCGKQGAIDSPPAKFRQDSATPQRSELAARRKLDPSNSGQFIMHIGCIN